MKKKTIIGIILALIILIGIILTFTVGLNYDLMYRSHKEIDIYIGKEFNNKDIYKLTKEVIQDKKVTIQKVELYEDMVSIYVEDITEEQLENLNQKINEKYELENKVDDFVVTLVPNEKGIDLVKPYIVPVSISFVVVIIYFAIYFIIYSKKQEKISVIKEIGYTVLIIIGVQLLYLSILAITRIPISRVAMPISIALYIETCALLLANFKRKYKKIEK